MPRLPPRSARQSSGVARKPGEHPYPKSGPRAILLCHETRVWVSTEPEGLSWGGLPAGRRTTGHRCPVSRWRPSRHRPGRTRSDQPTGPMLHRAGPVRPDAPSSRSRDGVLPRPGNLPPARWPGIPAAGQPPRTAATANRRHPLSLHGPPRHRHGEPPESGIDLHSAQMDTPDRVSAPASLLIGKTAGTRHGGLRRRRTD